MAQQSKNPGPYIQGHGTACHPLPKWTLSTLGPRRTHSLEASFLRTIKLTSIRFISFSYILVLYDCQISFSLKLDIVWNLRQEGLTFIQFIAIFKSYKSKVFLSLLIQILAPSYCILHIFKHIHCLKSLLIVIKQLEQTLIGRCQTDMWIVIGFRVFFRRSIFITFISFSSILAWFEWIC